MSIVALVSVGSVVPTRAFSHIRLADHVQGRNQTIFGVSWEVDINTIKLAVYNETEPKIVPTFDELSAPEGTGRLIVMQIFPGFSPKTF